MRGGTPISLLNARGNSDTSPARKCDGDADLEARVRGGGEEVMRGAGA